MSALKEFLCRAWPWCRNGKPSADGQIARAEAERQLAATETIGAEVHELSERLTRHHSRNNFAWLVDRALRERR